MYVSTYIILKMIMFFLIICSVFLFHSSFINKRLCVQVVKLYCDGNVNPHETHGVGKPGICSVLVSVRYTGSDFIFNGKLSGDQYTPTQPFPANGFTSLVGLSTLYCGFGSSLALCCRAASLAGRSGWLGRTQPRRRRASSPSSEDSGSVDVPARTAAAMPAATFFAALLCTARGGGGSHYP